MEISRQILPSGIPRPHFAAQILLTMLFVISLHSEKLSFLLSTLALDGEELF